MWWRCPYLLRSGVWQTGLRHPELVDEFKRRMLDGEWEFEQQGKSFVYWQEGRTVWIGEGHHRANAALELGRETGDWQFLERLLENGKREAGTPPSRNRSRFPTRSWWSSLALWLGW
jgi:hypothetical protein